VNVVDDRRTALLSRAIAILAEHGVEGLTFRAAARAAGVSPTSPYRYFADRDAFLAAVATEGIRLLIERMGEQAGTDLASLGVMASAYVDFARANPGLYQLMFSAPASGANTLPWLPAGSRQLVEFLSIRIRGLQRSEAAGPGDPATLAAALWANLHGVVMLGIGELSDGAGVPAGEVGEAAIRLMVQGIGRRPPVAGAQARAS
jgi:AcrR family transcriptional regulator